MSTLRILAAAALAAAVGSACDQTNFNAGPPPIFEPPMGPGTTAWADEEVACSVEADCAIGETCLDGVCQMARCNDGPYDSTAPLGDGIYFFKDQEILVADATAYMGSYWVDGYTPEGSTAYSGSWDMGGSAISDVVGGDFLGTRPHLFAVAKEFSTVVAIGDGTTTLDVGFVPVALAAGDVDRDHKDELIAIGEYGDIALCHVDEAWCDGFVINDVTGVDAAAADLDGDKFAEGVFLLDVAGESYLYVWNPDVEITGDADFGAFPMRTLGFIDAGDLDGDGVAEVVGYEDDSWVPWDDAHLYLFTALGGTVYELGAHAINNDTRDVALADFDMDEIDEVVALRSGGVVELLHGTGPGQLISDGTGALTVSGDPVKIAAADFDGDSPAGVLMKGPDLVPGRVVPTTVIHLPPYDRDHSDGTSSVLVGNNATVSETLSDSVSLNLGVELGVGGGIEGIFQASLSTKIYAEVTSSHSVTTKLSIGERVSAEANPELYGPDYGLVMLSCGCFNGYEYVLEDPAGKLGIGADGGRFVVLVPVAGQTTLWSTKRYNRMAAAVGTLPIIDIPYEVGDPTSYPIAPSLPDGTPVPSQDMVFPSPPTLLVSDIGNVGWWMSVGESETNAVTLNTGITTSASVNVVGVSFGAHLGAGWGQGYSVTVGEDAYFGGGTPPIPDDPSTPEDEYTSYAFSFMPYLYRRTYVDAAGEELGFYVLSYAVGL